MKIETLESDQTSRLLWLYRIEMAYCCFKLSIAQSLNFVRIGQNPEDVHDVQGNEADRE